MHKKLLRQGLIHSEVLNKSCFFNLAKLMSLICLILSPCICNKYLVYFYKVKVILQGYMGEQNIEGDIYTIERRWILLGGGKKTITLKKKKSISLKRRCPRIQRFIQVWGNFIEEEVFILDLEEWTRFPLANMTEGGEKHSRWREWGEHSCREWGVSAGTRFSGLLGTQDGGRRVLGS